jgi:hypothetical protein
MSRITHVPGPSDRSLRAIILTLAGAFVWAGACGGDDTTSGAPSTSTSTGTQSGSGGSASTSSTVTGSGGATTGGSAGGESTGMGGTGGSGSSGASGSGGSGAPPDGGSAGAKDAGSGGTSGGDAAACGGPVPSSMPDTHCATPDGGRGDSVPPHNGNEADDDNCLYHMKFTVPCIQRNQNVSFTLDMKNLGTMTPATGAAPEIEATIGNHPIPNSNPMTTEKNGVYTIGPVRFDRMGRWTLTFHVYDSAPAKHSHVSFYLDVP